MGHPTRKPLRLSGYNYSTPGAYFITICTKNRQRILSFIDVGHGVLDVPYIRLTAYGAVVEKQLRTMNERYASVHVDKYCIMPDHVHMLLRVTEGASGTPRPTQRQNAVVSRFVSTFKRFCNKEYGKNIWQERFYDHIIRGEEDYKEVWTYIDNNPAQWQEDHLYMSR